MCLPYFNPRSREGSDGFRQINLCRGNGFQSTLPRGERPYLLWNGMCLFKFQSTLPRGERLSRIPIMHGIPIRFQSTLPRGERLFSMAGVQFLSDFNPRSREGSDFSQNFARLILLNFNPRSREGSDATVGTCNCHASISIHAPARGATAILSKIHPMFLTISHNASSFSSFPFHSFLPHLLNSSTFCALFQVRISRGFSVYYRFAPKKSTPDLQLYHVLHRYVQL